MRIRAAFLTLLLTGAATGNAAEPRSVEIRLAIEGLASNKGIAVVVSAEPTDDAGADRKTVETTIPAPRLGARLAWVGPLAD